MQTIEGTVKAGPSGTIGACAEAPPCDTLPHPLFGAWSHDFAPEDTTEIVVGPETRGKSVRVGVRNKQSGEYADVYDISGNGKILSYNIYWKSTGRYLQGRLQPMQASQMTYTYMQTMTSMWSLKSAAG